MKKLKIALIANIPAPYRVPVYDLVEKFDISIIYCARNESNRSWGSSAAKAKQYFLKENSIARRDGFNFLHNNTDIFKCLNGIKPDIVITTGFGPTFLYAFLWSKFFGSTHICMTDGTVFSEAGLTWVHRVVRRLVYSYSSAFIAASNQGRKLFHNYGISDESIFTSQLCVDNQKFANQLTFENRKYDIMFSGQFHERKLPFFFFDICKALAIERTNLSVLLIGDGPLRSEVLSKFSESGVVFDYAGFVDQQDLPNFYQSAKILLFTTRMDPWGVVANEAMASGTPVVTSPYAGVANELVIDGISGAVCELDTEIWVRAVNRLLDDKDYWTTCSVNSRKLVKNYNFKSAAKGIENACQFALGEGEE